MLPQSERDLYYAREPDAMSRYRAMRLLVVPTPLVYAYLWRLVMESTVQKRRLLRQNVGIEFDALSLSAFFRLACYDSLTRLSYEHMMVWCTGHGALVRVLTVVV